MDITKYKLRGGKTAVVTKWHANGMPAEGYVTNNVAWNEDGSSKVDEDFDVIEAVRPGGRGGL